MSNFIHGRISSCHKIANKDYLKVRFYIKDNHHGLTNLFYYKDKERFYELHKLGRSSSNLIIETIENEIVNIYIDLKSINRLSVNSQ